MKPQYLERDLLAKKSVELILEHQDPSGSYIASPNFSQYNYAWLRDGSFCALAMYASGEGESASMFHSWVASTIERYESLFVEAAQYLEQGMHIPPEKCPPTRFHLNGMVEIDHHEAWPNYQLDGYGTWLAILHQTEPSPSESLLRSIRIVADFLAIAWSHPCYDCWEEGGEEVHGSTLIAVAGGLKAASEMTGESTYLDEYKKVIIEIQTNYTSDHHLVKNKGDSRIDASLAWGFLPHRAYSLKDPLVQNTLDEVKKQLQNPEGGVKRYLGDTYYGGGDWVLLEGLLAWNQAANGNQVAWAQSCKWFQSIADENHLLPEQILVDVQVPEMIRTWEKKWGLVAHPLLWSHAMYLLMLNEGAKQQWI